MNEGVKVSKRIEEEQSALERALKYVPGYRGYKEKEIRRETDRLVRSKVTAFVEKGMGKMDRALRATTEQKAFDVAKRMDRLKMVLSKLAEKIRHAPHGYAGLFDAIKVKEDDLDKLINFDASLTEVAEKIDSACRSVLEAVNQKQFDALDRGLDQVDDLTGQMEQLLSRREETMLGIGEE